VDQAKGAGCTGGKSVIWLLGSLKEPIYLDRTRIESEWLTKFLGLPEAYGMSFHFLEALRCGLQSFTAADRLSEAATRQRKGETSRDGIAMLDPQAQFTLSKSRKARKSMFVLRRVVQVFIWGTFRVTSIPA